MRVRINKWSCINICNQSKQQRLVQALLSIHPSIHLSIWIYLSTCIYLSIYLSIWIYLSTCIYLSVYLPIHLAIYLAIYLSIYVQYLSIYLQALYPLVILVLHVQTFLWQKGLYQVPLSSQSGTTKQHRHLPPMLLLWEPWWAMYSMLNMDLCYREHPSYFRQHLIYILPAGHGRGGGEWMSNFIRVSEVL